MTDQILVMDRLLNHTEGQGYIYCLKVVIQLLPMQFVQYFAWTCITLPYIIPSSFKPYYLSYCYFLWIFCVCVLFLLRAPFVCR